MSDSSRFIEDDPSFVPIRPPTEEELAEIEDTEDDGELDLPEGDDDE